jgi:heme exporter protein D
MSYRSFAGFPPLFYWATYGLTFLVPVLGLYHGLKSRKRIVINVSLIAALVTLATNKDYLGFKHYAWDPAVLGVVMVTSAVVIMRWLASGAREARNGFTAQNLLKPENHEINVADLGAAVLPGAIHASLPPSSPDKPFDGGQSGGGGASSEY